MKVFVSPQCPNCTRIVDIVRRIPKLQSIVSVVDITTLPPDQMGNLQYVPTIVTSSGQQYVGAQAFEYLKQYEGEMEVECAPSGLGTGRLAFATIGGDAAMQFVEGFGEFNPPPQ
jgi:hypothetical protein